MLHDYNALSAEQKRAAELLATNDVHKLTLTEIAAQCGVHDRTVYRWKQDKTFIAYKNEIAEKVMDDFLSDVYRYLREISSTSMSEKNKLKAIELVLKNRGKLTDVQKVEATIKDVRSEEAISEEIERLRRQLEEQ